MNDASAPGAAGSGTTGLARAARPAPRPRRSRGRRFYPIAAVMMALLATVAGTAWWQTSRVPPVRYATATVTRGNVIRAVTATGTVNPILTIIVGSYVSGVVQSLSCDYNTIVKAGQVCARIDPRPYQAALHQYTGQLMRDQGLLAEARRDLQRYQQLLAQNSIARQQVEDQAYLVQQDEGTVKLDEGLVEGARFNLEYTNITSPVDGTVVSRNVTQGQTVASTLQTPTLFLIGADLKKMEVDTNVSESDVGGLKVGDKASFTVDAYQNRVFHGTVNQVRLSPQEVQNVVTYDAVIGVDNKDLALMPGMTASTQIVVDEKKSVLRVPDPALRYMPGGLAQTGAGAPVGIGAPVGGTGRIWVLRDGEPAVVPVVLGLDDGNFTEIVNGDVQPGDQAVTGESRGQAAGLAGVAQPRL
jgi:HlyD family secretion protein